MNLYSTGMDSLIGITFNISENLIIIRTHSQGRWRGNWTIFFLRQLKLSDSFRFIANYIPVLLENVSFAVRKTVWYQQDETYAHILCQVTDDLVKVS